MWPVINSKIDDLKIEKWVPDSTPILEWDINKVINETADETWQEVFLKLFWMQWVIDIILNKSVKDPAKLITILNENRPKQISDWQADNYNEQQKTWT